MTANEEPVVSAEHDVELAENAIARTARKTYRCTAADEVLGFKVVARYTSKHGGGETTSQRLTREEAEQLAAEKVGQVAAWNMHKEPPEVSARFSEAEVQPIRNRNFPSRSEGCAGDINPGDRYVEYVGEAHPYGSGIRYCWACGVKTWSA